MKLTRLEHNPIIASRMFAEAGVPEDGENINGPSLIRVPDWIERNRRADPAANYYLYFADHKGRYIRMAWSEQATGPYRLYRPGGGVLKLGQGAEPEAKDPKGRAVFPMFDDWAAGIHIASPDAHVDDANRRIALYFHCPTFRRSKRGQGGLWAPSGQHSFAAMSGDGLDFNGAVLPASLGHAYMRVFQWNGNWYASACHLMLKAMKPQDPFSPYEPIAAPLDNLERTRHTALILEGDELTIFLTRKGDAPEHIMVSTAHLTPGESQWRAMPPVSVLKPERDYEGVNLTVMPSRGGPMRAPEHALRDPAYFKDADGTEYLLYSVAGECGIAMARLER